MTSEDRVSFVLTSALAIKKIKALDVIKEESQDHRDDADARFNADFTVMAGELSKLISALICALGGELPANGRHKECEEEELRAAA
ncbi:MULTISPECIES: recombination-associated protein RdgC [Cupriavidus]|uniref:recombination-associated protein RdgC n=1 Tax=Cupriavidus TaxID=106589 RepID=UPI000039EC94|nr:hypothetical protein C2U69_32030 [Cupriavidus pinatubonensis]